MRAKSVGAGMVIGAALVAGAVVVMLDNSEPSDLVVEVVEHCRSRRWIGPPTYDMKRGAVLRGDPEPVGDFKYADSQATGKGLTCLRTLEADKEAWAQRWQALTIRSSAGGAYVIDEVPNGRFKVGDPWPP